MYEFLRERRAAVVKINPHPNSPEIHIYTDGASLGNPGPGGWAALVRSGGRTRELSGGFRLTTNNRMELYAAIAALESLDGPADIHLHSDSRYLVEGITRGWAEQWRAKGWRQTKNRPTPNADLWARLLTAAARHTVSWVWVRGHAGHPENERADQLAARAASRKGLPADDGYETSQADLNGSGGASRSLQDQPGLFEGGQNAPGEVLPTETLEKPAAGRRAGTVSRAGQPCRICGTPVVRQTPSRKIKPDQTYYYAWYLVCPNCKTIYLVDEARRAL